MDGRFALICVTALVAALAGGCAFDGWSAGGPAAAAPSAGGTVSPGREDAAYRLMRLTRQGDYAEAHLLADQQAAAATDPVMALWWRTQHLTIYTYEGEPWARSGLAQRLAREPAAGEPAFLFSSGAEDLFAALADADRPESAARLARARYDALLAIGDRERWWHHEMARTSRWARTAGDPALADSAAALVLLPPGDPYREMLATPGAARPPAVIQPGAGR